MAFDSGEASEPSWTARNEYWLGQIQRGRRKRPKRSRETEPLILCGDGVGLNIERDTLVVRNGFTHYPQERETYRFFRGDLNLPTRIIALDASGAITFDVLEWLASHGVALIQLNWRGDVITMAGGTGFAGDPSKLRWQIETRADPARRLKFSTDLIRRKLVGSIETLKLAVPQSTRRDTAIIGLSRDLEVLATRPLADVTALRAIEARAGACYFLAWRGVQMAFRSSAKYPVPDNWRAIGSRSAVRAGKPKNDRATHPLNAMLNYAYAVLQGQLTIGVVAAGFDPSIGIMHHGYKGSAAYIFDLMEPERPKVDHAILSLAFSETFSGADFTITNDGACRLAPQLANVVARLAGDITAVKRCSAEPKAD